MSDIMVKLIPADPRHVPPAEAHRPAAALLRRLVPGGDPRGPGHPRLQYIDAGEDEEGAECPRCGRQVCFDWSPEHEAEMDWFRDIVHRTERTADGVRTVMPCCGAEVPFEEVRFGNSGFAVFELVVSN